MNAEEIERDRRIIAAVACPFCDAAIGDRCRHPSGAVRGMPHAERLAAWRASHVSLSPDAPLDRRDAKIIAMVPCPYCKVAIGARCVRYPGSDVTIARSHGERREAWQMVSPTAMRPNAPPVRCTCGHTGRQHSADPARGCKECACMRTKADIRAA